MREEQGVLAYERLLMLIPLTPFKGQILEIRTPFYEFGDVTMGATKSDLVRKFFGETLEFLSECFDPKVRILDQASP